MAGIHDTTEDAILNLLFRAVTWAGYASAVGTETNIGIALHTADPTDTGTAATSEMTTGAYAGYTRVNVGRTTGAWSASAAGSVSPVANIDFPAGTGGTGATANFFSTSSSNATPPTGAAAVLWSGAIAPPIVCGNGVTPRLTPATVITLT